MFSLPQFLRSPIRNLRTVAGLLALLAALLAFSGCGSHATHDAQPAAMVGTGEVGICEREWILHSLVVDGREHKPRMFWQKMWRDRPYFTCDKLGFVRGSGGSNPFLGKFALDDSGAVRWLKSPKISRMVGRRDSGELEQDFLLAMPRISHARVSGDTLILQGDDGTRLEFKPTSEQPSS